MQTRLDKPARLSFSCSLDLLLNIDQTNINRNIRDGNWLSSQLSKNLHVRDKGRVWVAKAPTKLLHDSSGSKWAPFGSTGYNMTSLLPCSTIGSFGVRLALLDSIRFTWALFGFLMLHFAPLASMVLLPRATFVSTGVLLDSTKVNRAPLSPMWWTWLHWRKSDFICESLLYLALSLAPLESTESS